MLALSLGSDCPLGQYIQPRISLEIHAAKDGKAPGNQILVRLPGFLQNWITIGRDSGLAIIHNAFINSCSI